MQAKDRALRTISRSSQAAFKNDGRLNNERLKSHRKSASGRHSFRIRLLKAGLALTGIASGWIGSAAVLQLPVSQVLANVASAAASDSGLLNAAGEPHIAQGLPENTPYAMFFSTQDESLAGLAQFELFAKIADAMGGLSNPLGVPFLPAGFELEYEGEKWAGAQSAIALLPEIAPRRVSPTDLDTKFYSLSRIADAAEFTNFVSAVETARAEAPEQKVYQGATLWVWPPQTQSFSDYDSSDYDSDEGFELDDSEFEPPKLEPPKLEEPNAEALSKRSPKSTQLAIANQKPLPEIYSNPLPEPADTYVMPGLTIAQIGDYAVIAPNAQTVKDVIEYQLQPSRLSENEVFTRSQYIQQADALVHIYANVEETSKFDVSDHLPGFGQFPILPGLPDLPGLPNLPAMPELFSVESRLLASRLTQGMTAEAVVYAQSEGLRLQGRLYGNELFKPVATPEWPYADSAIQYVPAPAYSLGSGRNLYQYWQRVAGFLSREVATQGLLDQARSLVFSTTGLDLDTELIGWMDQEIAFFSFPSDRGLTNSTFPGAGVEFGLAVQTSDRAKAETALSALGNVAQGFLATEIAVDTLVNDQPAVDWRVPTDGVQPDFSFLGHSWVSDDTVMFTSGIGAMNRILNATAFEPLDEHPTFLNATRSLANPNNGYSYVNAGSSLSLIYGFVEDWFELDPNDPFFVSAKSYLGTVRSLSGTTSSTTDYWQLDSLVNLAPAEAASNKAILIP